MILYSDTVGNFINSCQGPNPVIGQLLLDKFKAQHIGGGSNSEYNAWIHSLPKVAEALKDNAIPKEAGVGVEYKLIDTKQRVDFLIFGNDNENNENVILIELKQWSEARKSALRDYVVTNGGAQASASPIYQKFIQQAIKLKPRYLSMIVPSRWMTGGKGLDDFRNEMLHDNRMSIIHDFKDASLCFTGVEIKGGVNYFLWDRDKTSPVVHIINDNGNQVATETDRTMLEDGCDIFIRNNELVSIYRKVKNFNEQSFSLHVSPRKPNGFCGDMFKNPSKYGLPAVSEKPFKNGYSIYGLDGAKRAIRYIPSNYPIPKKDFINDYKMFMARNQGAGLFGEKFSEPVFAKPGELCTETFVVIGGFKTEKEMMNCWSYIKTKFFRALVGVKKNDQGAASGVYQYVPLQDFSKPWTDKELYEKYGLNQKEIDFIENNVESMED